MGRIDVLYFTDPACPWAYSASPALTVLRWRYGAQLRWRLVAIGLGEGTTLACRALVCARLLDPDAEWDALRALQYGWMADGAAMGTEEGVAAALARVRGLDVERVLQLMHGPVVGDAFTHDRALARSAAGGPAEFQGRTAATGGEVRYTAPSLVFRAGDRRLEVGGFQPLEAYDICIANLDPTLERRGAPADPGELLEAFPHGLTTREVAACLAGHLEGPDEETAERALLDLASRGLAAPARLADGPLWLQSQTRFQRRRRQASEVDGTITL